MDKLQEIWSEYLFTPGTGTVSVILAVLSVIGMWLLFKKADKAGWRSIIPIVNIYTLVQIADRGWKIILFLIPVVNAIYYILFSFRLARAFGKGALFSLGLIFFSPFFILILGLGSARYRR